MNNYNVYERQGLFIEIEEASIFVYVTKKENALLKPFQKEGYDESWQTTYKKAGIKFKEY